MDPLFSRPIRPNSDTSMSKLRCIDVIHQNADGRHVNAKPLETANTSSQTTPKLNW